MTHAWVPCRLTVITLTACICTTTGCLADEKAVGPVPMISQVKVEPTAYNELAAAITFSAVRVDSARVVYTPLGDASHSTPCAHVLAESARIVVLGLQANTSYAYQVVSCGVPSVTSSIVSTRTSGLPTGLQDVAIHMTGSLTPGWILLSTARDSLGYLMAFDSTGAIRWYRSFPLRAGEQALDGKQLANGNYAVFIGATQGWQPTYGRDRKSVV